MDLVGKQWREYCKKQHPLKTLIEYAEKLSLNSLVATLQTNNNNKATFIHNSCRTELRNASKRKRNSSSPNDSSSNKRLFLTSEHDSFDFKTQCFYCSGSCIFDLRHPDRNKFEKCRIEKTKIQKSTLEICNQRDDKLAKEIKKRLLSINDLVAADGRYHVVCRPNFENPVPQKETVGRPTCTEKMTLFNEACKKNGR